MINGLNRLNQGSRYHRQTGMTLLELSVVLLILVTLATIALRSTVGLQDQARFEATSNQLENIAEALVGNDTASFNGQHLLSGYVVDNGVLPGSVDDLIGAPVDFDGFGARSPTFDSDPDATGINNATNETTLNEDAQTLYKGYRPSNYLSLPIGATTSQDGWGNGWNETNTTATVFDPQSLGADNLAGTSGGIYDPDLSNTINSIDWQIDINGWSITVINFSGTDIAIGEGNTIPELPLEQCLRASLLVYVNNTNNPADNNNWKRLTTNCAPSNAASDSCIDGDNDGTVTVGINTAPCPNQLILTFPNTGGGTGAYQPNTLIPQGEHILVLLQDSDLTDAHNDNSESPFLNGANFVTSKVQFFANRSLPNAQLIIR